MSEHSGYTNVTLKTVDSAIRDWFDKSVDSHVSYPNGSRKKVAITFSAGERWVTAREKKGVRDDNGMLILPIISLRRTSIEPTPTMSALGAETANLQISRRISPKTNDLMNLDRARQPQNRFPAPPVVYEVATIPFPDRSILTYEMQVQAQYVNQLNEILEKIFHELDINKSFVAPFENDNKRAQIGEEFEDRKKIDRAYVVGFFEQTLSDSGNLEEFTDQERIVRFNTSFTVPAVLQLDPEGENPVIKVERTAFNIGFSDENVILVDNPEDFEKIFG